MEEVITLEKEVLKIETCKHSAARTALEQACDVAPIFRELKRLILLLLDYNVNVKESKWTRELDADLRELGMRIDGSKMKLLVAVIIVLPKCMIAAYTTKNVCAGFIDNGMIDVMSGTVPDSLRCLDTLRLPYFGNTVSFEDKKEHLRSVLKVIIPEYVNNGYPDESTYLRIQIPMDKNEKGEEVPKPDGVRSENRHRAKFLSSPMSRYQRIHAIYRQKLSSYNKVIANRAAEQDILKDNATCEMIFVEWLKKFSTDNENQSYKDITVDILTKHPERDYTGLPSLTKKLLQAFIRARRPATTTKSTGKMRFYTPRGNKDAHIAECFELRQVSTWDLHNSEVTEEPVEPQLPAIESFNSAVL